MKNVAPMKDSLDMERRDRITDRKIININLSTEIIITESQA